MDRLGFELMECMDIIVVSYRTRVFEVWYLKRLQMTSTETEHRELLGRADSLGSDHRWRPLVRSGERTEYKVSLI